MEGGQCPGGVAGAALGRWQRSGHALVLADRAKGTSDRPPQCASHLPAATHANSQRRHNPLEATTLHK